MCTFYHHTFESIMARRFGFVKHGVGECLLWGRKRRKMGRKISMAVVSVCKAMGVFNVY